MDSELMAYQTLTGILEKLPTEQFVHIHKSYVVDLAKIYVIEGSTVQSGGQSLPIGRSFRQDLLEKLLKAAGRAEPVYLYAYFM